MAAVTVFTTAEAGTGASTALDAAGESRKFSMLGSQHIARKVSIAADGDTYATGLTNITRLAWEPDAGTDAVGPHFATAADKRAGTVTFKAGAAANGILHIFVD